MEDAMLMKINQSLKNLVQEALSLFFWQRFVSFCPHILFEIEFDIFKDEIKLFLRVDDFFQSKHSSSVSTSIFFAISAQKILFKLSNGNIGKLTLLHSDALDL